MGRNRIGDRTVELIPRHRPHAEGRHHRVEMRSGGGLIGGDAHVVAIHPAEVHPTLQGGSNDGVCPPRHRCRDGVEAGGGTHVDPSGGESGGQQLGVAMGAGGNIGEAVRPVVHRVHGGNNRQEHLGGADVGGGLLPPNVLLAGLEGQPVRPVAVGVDRHAHEAARQRALQPISHRHVARMWPAEAQRDAEALGDTHHHICPHGTGGAEQAERQQVCVDRHHCANLMGRRNEIGPVDHPARRTRVGKEDAEGGDPAGQTLAEIGHHDGKTNGLGAGLDHRNGLRVTICVNQEDGIGGHTLSHPARQRHCLGGCGCFVQQRRIGQGHPGEVRDHGLKVQERLEAALGDLWLIRRVGRVPRGAFHHVPENHAGGDRVAVAQPDHGSHHLIAVSQRPQIGQGLGLGACWWQVQRVGETNPGGDGRFHQIVERCMPEGGQHLGLVLDRWSQVPALKGSSTLQGSEVLASGHGGLPGRWRDGSTSPAVGGT